MLYREGDTIVAPATAPGAGAIAVVRGSGPGAMAIADEIFRGRRPSKARPGTVLHGAIAGEEGGEIDEVLLVSFRAPRSYTGEDSFEVSCHGGPYLVRRIVARIVAAGARVAGPGEFTRRAFRNGKIDLAQAESVADLIRARSEGAARSALLQLGGALSERVGRLRQSLLDLLALVEADLDFAEEEHLPGYDPRAALRETRRIEEILGRLERAGERGRLVRDGARVAIVGRPNTGKSTLFNALVGEARAIVSAEPGTTRDLIEGEIEIGGFLFRLTDTAGMREGAGGVEGEGVRRSERRLAEADLLCVVVDRSEPLADEDRRLLRSTGGRRRIVVLTKCDLRDRLGALPPDLSGAESVAAARGRGIDRLRARLAGEMERRAIAPGDEVVTSVRHVAALGSARRALARAGRVAGEGELFAEELREALDRLGEITGEGAREELLDAIFSRFCIGK